MKKRFWGFGILIAVAAIYPVQTGWAAGNSNYDAAGGQGSVKQCPYGGRCQGEKGKSANKAGGRGQDKGVRDHGEGYGAGKGQGKGRGGEHGKGPGRGKNSGR